MKFRIHHILLLQLVIGLLIVLFTITTSKEFNQKIQYHTFWQGRLHVQVEPAITKSPPIGFKK